jgi:WD40 repeat protein
LIFSPDGRRLLGGSLDGSIKVWDMNTGSEVRTLRGHTRGVTGLALPADGRRLASSALDGTVRIWEWDREQEALTLEEPLGAVHSLAFHPDGRHLASGSLGASLWDVPAGKVDRSYKEFLVNYVTMAVAFSPDGKRLATGGRVVKVWDTDSGKKLFGEDPSFFSGPKAAKEDEDVGSVWALAFSPDGKHLASESSIRDAATGKQVRRIAAGKEGGPFAGLGLGGAYSPDGKQLASGEGKVVTLADAVTGEVVQTFPEFPDFVLKVAFSRDGRRLLAASDSSARVWELPSGRQVFDFRLTSTFTPTNQGWIHPGKASFSADGQRLAMAPGDGTVKVWDTTTGQPILSLSAPGSEVFCVAFSPDGRWLAAGGHDGAKGILRIWDARPVEP